MDAQITPVADHAILVTLADEIGDPGHAAVCALDTALTENAIDGVIETVPALVNILIHFDPLITDHDTVAAHVRSLLRDLTPLAAQGEEHIIRVCYDAELAPDLAAVADTAGLSPEAAAAAHGSGIYKALMYGFAPGYAYLTGVPPVLDLPRKPKPVRDVPAGSVIIAGRQCLITTLTMPTGWWIIGQSPDAIFTGDTVQPFRFNVGDTVAFERIDRAAFETLRQSSSVG